LILLAPDTGEMGYWLLNGTTKVAAGPIYDTTGTNICYATGSWKPLAVGDLDGDNKPDILWEDGLGEIGVWFMDGVIRRSASLLNPWQIDSHWKFVGAGDANYDGKTDIFFQYSNTNMDDSSLGVWYMSGTNQQGSSALNPTKFGDVTYRVVAVADFNGDCTPDIVFQQQTNSWGGNLASWYLTYGVNAFQTNYLTNYSPGSYNVVGPR
jgi:hypothetical protein